MRAVRNGIFQLNKMSLLCLRHLQKGKTMTTTKKTRQVMVLNFVNIVKDVICRRLLFIIQIRNRGFLISRVVFSVVVGSDKLFATSLVIARTITRTYFSVCSVVCALIRPLPHTSNSYFLQSKPCFSHEK